MNLINMIDKIEDECLTQESFVLSRVCDVYLKASTLLESYEGDDLSSFEIFQEQSIREDMKEQSKGMGIIMKFLTLIPRLVKAIINKIKNNKSVDDNITPQQKKEADDYVKRIIKSGRKSRISSDLKGLIFAISFGAVGSASIFGILKLKAKIKDIRKIKNDKEKAKRYIEEYTKSNIEGMKQLGVNVNDLNLTVDEKMYENSKWVNHVINLIEDVVDDNKTFGCLELIASIAIIYDANQSNYDKNNVEYVINIIRNNEAILLKIAEELISKDDKVKKFAEIFRLTHDSDHYFKQCIIKFKEAYDGFSSNVGDNSKYVHNNNYGSYDEFKKKCEAKEGDDDIIKNLITYTTMLNTIEFRQTEEKDTIRKDSEFIKKILNDSSKYLTKLKNDLNEYNQNREYIQNIWKQAVDSEKSFDEFRKDFPKAYFVFKELYSRP